MRTVEIKTNGKTYLITDLPKGITGNELGLEISKEFTFNGIEWISLGFASSLSEKEWAGILGNTTESGKSWLEANGIADWTNPFLLIKK